MEGILMGLGTVLIGVYFGGYSLILIGDFCCYSFILIGDFSLIAGGDIGMLKDFFELILLSVFFADLDFDNDISTSFFFNFIDFFGVFK
jgi:hypothetical protein